MITPADIKEVNKGAEGEGAIVDDTYEEDENPIETAALDHLDDCFDLFKELMKRKRINPYFAKQIRKQADTIATFLIDLDYESEGE